MDSGDQTVVDEVAEFINSFLPKKKPVSNRIPARRGGDALSDIHARAKTVYPDCFVGAKIQVVRELAERIRLSQQYHHRYRKNPFRSYAHCLYKEMQPKVGNDLLVDTGGSATVTFADRLQNGLDLKVSSRIRDVTASEVEVSIGRAFGNGSGSMSVAAQDVDPQSLRLVCQYLHSVSDRVSVGAELLTRPVSEDCRVETSVSARYSSPSVSVSATLGHKGFQMCLFRKITNEVRVASVVDCAHCGGKTPTLSLAVRGDLGVDSHFKMFVDSNQTTGLTFEKVVRIEAPDCEEKSVTLSLSSLVARRRRVELGVGFLLDL